MSKALFNALPGTRDLQAPETDRIRALVAIFAEMANGAGFGQVVPPVFEEVGVFARLGEASDVVSKELYDFTDKGGRHIALRPEHTASVCRIFAQRRPLTPWKTWYYGSNFRYDKPQKGRYRQFDQVGVEVIGSNDPDIDTEVVALGWRFFERVGLRSVTLELNSLGDPEDRARYVATLAQYFADHRGDLSEQSQTTLQTNPLRLLDSKRPQDQAIIDGAPSPDLGDAAAAALARVTDGLDALAVPYRLAPRLVRGLDYYTRTTFEYVSSAIDGAQTAVGGGGRYDGLVEALGGPSEPGVGFALGVDRTLLAADGEEVFGPPDMQPTVWVVSTTDDLTGVRLADALRQNGISADRSYDGRSMKAQMKAANRSGARYAAIVGPDEAESATVVLRSLQTDDDQITMSQEELARFVLAQND